MENIKESLIHLKDKITDLAELAIKGIAHNQPSKEDLEDEERKKISAEINLTHV